MCMTMYAQKIYQLLFSTYIKKVNAANLHLIRWEKKSIEMSWVAMYLWTSYVTSGWTKTFCKSPHQNIDILWVTFIKINDTAAIWAQSTDAVRLIQIDVRPILLFQSNQFGQIDNRSFHTKHTLNHNQYLFPWLMCFWLAFNNRFTQHLLQVFHVVVPEHPNGSARQSQS